MDWVIAIRDEARALGLVQRDPAVVPIRSDEFPSPASRPPFSVLDKTSTWEALGSMAPHWRGQLRRMLRELKEGDGGKA